jgi:hypothetical protein
VGSNLLKLLQRRLLRPSRIDQLASAKPNQEVKSKTGNERVQVLISLDELEAIENSGSGIECRAARRRFANSSGGGLAASKGLPASEEKINKSDT